ncbi:hypothetical protein PENPOL_c014G03237 [Penicillium polonicum]|uniref:Uncharacterized protein n=1 Tax=Penicillium polonicum TaxID=60169 RepID=A0A1V6NBR4_PENPO|nr:hypothetical protein PENPOL_c014G03237 [Penicillium polonicum]
MEDSRIIVGSDI